MAQAIGDSDFELHVWARRPQHLESYAADVFGRLAAADQPRGLARDPFITGLAAFPDPGNFTGIRVQVPLRTLFRIIALESTGPRAVIGLAE